MWTTYESGFVTELVAFGKGQAYRATDAGVSGLQEWLEDPDSQPQLLREEFYMKLVLLGRHPNGQLERLLNRQRQSTSWRVACSTPPRSPR